MNLPDFTGADAPIATLDGDTLALRYASREAYEARVHQDFAALTAAPGVRVVESSIPHVPAHLGHVVMLVRVADAPAIEAPAAPAIEAPAASLAQTSRKSR